jgi:hypothetical protein
MSLRCACDACDVVFGPHDARTPDGYCGFCSGSCFPAGAVAGKAVRTSMNRDSRLHLHAMARVARSAADNLPANPAAAAEAARHEAADAFVRLMGPLVDKAGKAVTKTIADVSRSAVDAVRRKIRE